MQFHLGGGRNIRWTEARRTRWVVDILRERFQSKRFFQKGLIFEAEMFDMRNGVKQRHMHGQYRIVSDMEEFWKKFEKEIQRFFSRVDGEAKNFDHSILEIRIGAQTYFRHKFKTDNDKRLVLILGFSKLEEPTTL